MNIKLLGDLLLEKFTDFILAFMLLALGFGFGKGSSADLNADVPFLILIALSLLFVATIVEAIRNIGKKADLQ